MNALVMLLDDLAAAGVELRGTARSCCTARLPWRSGWATAWTATARRCWCSCSTSAAPVIRLVTVHGWWPWRGC